jgi:hypothetical protein
MSACLCLVTQHRAGDDAMTEQVHRQANDSRGPIARAVVA